MSEPDPGVGTFYAYLPDLPIAQVTFLTGLTAAVLGALALRTGSGLRSLRRSAVAVTTACWWPGPPSRWPASAGWTPTA